MFDIRDRVFNHLLDIVFKRNETMETVKTRQLFYEEHKAGIKVVQVEDTKKFLVLHDGYIYDEHTDRIMAEAAVRLLKTEEAVTGELDVALAIAAHSIFENTGKILSMSQKAELLQASCNSLVRLYEADGLQERRNKK